MMTDTELAEELSPIQQFVQDTKDELSQVRTEVKEIGLLVEQSQGEVDKLAQRNASITAHMHQMQAQFDSIPREDIRSTYEAFQDAQQRLFTMRGQLEKLQSDETHLKRYEGFLVETLQIVEGKSPIDVGDQASEGDAAVRKIIEAQEDERRNMSRQIHDGPAQALSNFILQTEIAMRLFNTDQSKAKDELNNLKATAASTFAQVRDFIFDLRPMMLDDLGLVPTARRYIEAVKDKSGLDVTAVVTGTERRIEPHIEVIAFRTIQKLLHNVRDFAQATQAKIRIDLGDSELRISVEDNGKGFDVENLSEDERANYGFPNLEDRLEMLGGSLDLDSAAGEGSRINFTIPIKN
jgi:two-component system sensor histidine kinase DegS